MTRLVPRAHCWDANHLAGEVAHLGRQRRGLSFDGAKEDVLTQTPRQTRQTQRQHEERRGRGDVGEEPSHEHLAPGRVELGSRGDASHGRVGSRSDVDHVQRVKGFLIDQLRTFFHGAPSPNLTIGHRDACEDGQHDDDADEDLAQQIGCRHEAVEEGIDAVVVGTEGQLFLLRHGKDGSIKVEGDHGLVDQILDLLERGADDVIGEVLHLCKGGDGAVQLGQALIQARRQVEIVQLVQRGVDVEGGNGAVAAKDLGHAVKGAGELVQIVLEAADVGVDVVANVAERLVQEAAHVLGHLQRDVQAPADGQCDEAQVGRGEQVQDEDDDLFDAGDAQQQHRHQAVDRLLHSRRGDVVDALRHVMRQGRHGAAHTLDPRARRQGLLPGRVDVVVETADGQKYSDQDQEQKDGPLVDPRLRQASTESEIRSQAWSRVRRGSQRLLRAMLPHLIFPWTEERIDGIRRLRRR